MAPRLRPLLLLPAAIGATWLPGACAPPAPERETAALRAALASGRASLAALGAAPLPADAPAPARPSPGPRPPPVPAEQPAPPPAVAAASPPPATAAELLGAGPELLRQRLGPPLLRRAEGPAEIWLYAGPACALDLVLYPEGGGGRLRVAHAAARASGAESRTEAACLGELAAGAGRGGANLPRRPAAAGAPAERDA